MTQTVTSRVLAPLLTQTFIADVFVDTSMLCSYPDTPDIAVQALDIDMPLLSTASMGISDTRGPLRV